MTTIGEREQLKAGGKQSWLFFFCHFLFFSLVLFVFFCKSFAAEAALACNEASRRLNQTQECEKTKPKARKPIT